MSMQGKIAKLHIGPIKLHWYLDPTLYIHWDIFLYYKNAVGGKEQV